MELSENTEDLETKRDCVKTRYSWLTLDKPLLEYRKTYFMEVEIYRQAGLFYNRNVFLTNNVFS